MEWLSAIADFFNNLFNWLIDIWNLFLDTLYRFLLSFSDMFKDLFCWLLDSVLDIALEALHALDAMFDAFNVLQYWDLLPPDVSNVLGAIGIGTATGMIVTAITIRLTLQLIPFTRLGS